MTERGATARRIPEPPRGMRRLVWIGPGFLWMVSAAGSGELLFTPRVGALYGYSLLWALLAAVAPLGLYFAIGEPVRLLKVARGVEAAHIPVVAVLTLLLNRRLLPEPLRPGAWATALTSLAALFFAAFAVFYVYETVS